MTEAENTVINSINKPIRYCKDCKWYQEFDYFPELSYCLNPEITKEIEKDYPISFITGKKPYIRPIFAKQARATHPFNKCGMEAIFFEQRELPTSKRISPWIWILLPIVLIALLVISLHICGGGFI